MKKNEAVTLIIKNKKQSGSFFFCYQQIHNCNVATTNEIIISIVVVISILGATLQINLIYNVLIENDCNFIVIFLIL